MELYSILKYTKSICPICKKLLDAQIFSQSNKVYMGKRCDEHGRFTVLLNSDEKNYKDIQRFNWPGRKVKKFFTEESKGCPYDCGLCPEHKQHSCVGIIEVTSACNLRCPTCFANSSTGKFLSLKQIDFMLDRLVESEGEADIIQFSGGEPTIYPYIIEAVKLANSKKIKMAMINTNGVRIAEDENFVKELSKLNVSVYLQLDGFEKETHMKLIGQDLRETKDKAVKNLQKYKIPFVPVARIQKNVNEHEIGKLVEFAINTKGTRGIVLQPTFYSGRAPAEDMMNKVTIPDVIKSISNQSSIFEEKDFYPIPCCTPNCTSATFVYTDGGSTTPITRLVNVEDHMDYFKNRIYVDIKEEINKILSLYSKSFIANPEKVAEAYCSLCNISMDVKGLEEKIKLILIEGFMDEWNFDVERVKKCCVSEILPDGKIIPFCAFNSIYRDQYTKYFR